MIFETHVTLEIDEKTGEAFWEVALYKPGTGELVVSVTDEKMGRAFRRAYVAATHELAEEASK